MQDEVRKLKAIEMHVSYVLKLVTELKEQVDDRLSLAEQIRAKKVLGMPLTTEEKSFIRALRRLEK